MTMFLLIRHGLHQLGPETLAARTPGVELSREGAEQARRLADRLAHLPIRAIYSSPMERTRQTAQPLAERFGHPVHLLEAFHEVDFGGWSGRAFDELRALPEWRLWNSFRSGSSAPGRETMIQAQARAVGEMLRLRDEHGDEFVAIFSHGDVIRAAAAYWLGVPLDLFLRIEISPASVTAIRLGAGDARVLYINNTGEFTV